MDFIFFLGRLHVLALHLPIGILMMAVGMDVYGNVRRDNRYGRATDLLWAAGAASALLTVVLGLMHATEVGAGEPGVVAHRNAGVLLLLTSAAISGTRLVWPSNYARYWWAGAAATTGLLVVTGHLGGNLTHGPSYLVEFAPAPLREFAGLDVGPPKVKSLGEADLFANAVNVSLQQRCSSCHNDSKRSGEFSVANYESLMKGGSAGPVVVGGDLAKSDLFRRISLSHDDKDFMPRSGKTPLTPEQVKVIGWWIQTGARRNAPLAKLALPADMRPALLQVLGLPAAPGTVAKTLDSSDELPTGPDSNAEDASSLNVPAADPATVSDVLSRGFAVRSIAHNSTLLDVSLTPNRRLANDDLAALARLGPQVLRLDLSGAGLVDADMPVLASFLNVEVLKLSSNRISDSGIGALNDLKRVQSVNLSQTLVSAGGAARLANLPRIKTIYLWRPDAAAASATINKNGRVISIIAQAPRSAPGQIGKTTDEQLFAMKKLLAGESN